MPQAKHAVAITINADRIENVINLLSTIQNIFLVSEQNHILLENNQATSDAAETHRANLFYSQHSSQHIVCIRSSPHTTVWLPKLKSHQEEPDPNSRPPFSGKYWWTKLY